MKMSKSRRFYTLINGALCWGMGILCLIPVWYMFCLSLSDKNAIISGHVSLWPIGFTFDNYKYVIKDIQFFRSTAVSALRVILGLIYQTILVVLAAYPLSMRKERFAARQIYVWFFMVPMLFSGGMIPSYLLVANLGIMDTIWALVLTGSVPVFHVILLQNFIKELPDALTEAAMLDGAGHFRMLIQIILPLCKPCLATITLFTVLGHWNEWFKGMLYINTVEKLPLQTYLRSILIKVDLTQMTDLDTLAQRVAQEGTNAAKVFVAIFPILVVYPFLQKYFTKGLVMGSVKG